MANSHEEITQLPRSGIDESQREQTKHENDEIKAFPENQEHPIEQHTEARVNSDNVQRQVEDKPYSVFTHNEKRIIVICAGLCQFFSPTSGQIYFPSLDAIASDLNVSSTLVNLTITAYLIMQGLAPAFVGGFSDTSGRRPAYLACFVVYMAANIALALQNNYYALLILRMVQSAGGSGTVALSSAVVADIVTSQERGTYVSYISIAPQAGPSIGPIIGGLLGQYLGWHSIFWFLTICTGVVFIPVVLFFPETCREVVDDGSVPPPKWSWCYINTKIEKRFQAEGRALSYEKRDDMARNRKLRFPSPWESIKIVFTKEAGFILLYIGMVCCGYYATITLIPSQFGSVYGFNQLQISLCYLPLGVGSLLAAFIRGRIIDSRYKYHAKRLNMPLQYNRHIDLSHFPIEKARIEVAIPTLFLGTACMIGFGWMIQYKVNLSGPLILLFVIRFCTSASLNTINVLLVDIFPGRAGSATAANNLVRCWLGAGATSGVVPLIDRIGIGWTTTFFAALNVLFCPILWYVMKNGPEWRRKSMEKKKQQGEKKAARAEVDGEKGKV